MKRIARSTPQTHPGPSPRRQHPRGRLTAACLLLGSLAQGPAVHELYPDYLWRSWDTDHGLPSPRINALALAPDGFLWLATAAGLVRFDGLDFTTYNASNTPALGDNRVLSLHRDRSNRLWAGTADGRLLQWQNGQWTRLSLHGERATQGRSILAIADEPDGTLWLATDGAGLLRVDPTGKTETFGPAQGVPSLTVNQVLRDLSNRVWAVARGRLCLKTDQNWMELHLPGASDVPVRTIAPARNGGLWVATLTSHPMGSRGTHLWLYQNGAWSEPLAPYPWPQESTRSRAQAIWEDAAGRVWCATAGGGVFVYEPDQGWAEVSADLPPAQLQVLCLLEDEQGTIWIGTRTLGLLQVRPRPVTALPLPSQHRPHVFLCAAADARGRIWAGTDGAGLFEWDQQGWKAVNIDGGPASRYIAVLLADRSGTLWIGTFGGLYRLQGQQCERPSPDPALEQTTTALYEDRMGRIWAGTRSGLVCLDNHETRVYATEAGLPLTPARAITEDPDGRLWVAFPGEGLFRQEGETFEPVQVTNPATLRNIRGMTFDARGRLWFTTLGDGLGCLIDGHVHSWTSANGLPTDHLLALIPSGDRLWISSENGIFAVRPDELLARSTNTATRIRVFRLTPRDGLPFKVCTGIGQPGATTTPDGALLFPNGAALVRFQPELFLEQPRVRPPRVVAVRIDGQLHPWTPGNPVEVISGAVSYEFQYTSPHLLAPDRIRYRYQLEGLDRQPVEAGPRRVAFYNRLPPGHYTFRLWAAGPDETWVEAALPLPLTIHPRWWERRSIQTAGVLALTALISLTVWRWERNRSRRRMEQLRWQRAMDLERQRIARDIHDDLGSGLTEIILLSDTLREETSHQPASHRLAEEIATCARRLTRAMDEVVWAINPRHDTLESLLTYLNRFAQDHLNRAGIRCRWDVPLEVPPVPLSAETRHHLYLACKEALNNVVKHSGASEVWVRLQLNGVAFELSIEDNGRGFNPDPNPTGNGLRNMQQRLSEIGGTCSIQSRPGQGTRVHFYITASRHAAHPNPH
ncbi:hypothetical protein G4L39_00445 [Limisphaera ngatamarikiensis]|uniref:Histidine kinase domain-containing protein n=1 Tax=Limisphaera ngatamarikiensis TaxID=1324935 RepID=A0A6M1RM95_9BACT|nr:sensor histidine kinase [Limisphaera ngatamarikiensis]NGO37875.1 hypothetical protein [Limisphaera ngatamarikiensis]